MPDLEKWKNQTRTVTLTNEEWNDLSFYIRITTKHRENERDSWLTLSQEKNPDGTARFKNAANNADYWREAIDKLERIVKKIDGMDSAS